MQSAATCTGTATLGTAEQIEVIEQVIQLEHGQMFGLAACTELCVKNRADQQEII